MINELFYQQIGSTWTLDTLFLYLSVPLALIGLILNTLSYLIFKEIKFQKKQFKIYIKMYTLFSMLICILNVFNSIVSIPRYFDFILTYAASWYRCRISTWFSITLYYYTNVIDCVLLLERISNITNYPLIKSFFKINSYLICFVLFIICNLTNIISYFFVTPRKDETYMEVMKNIDLLVNFTYCKREPFFQSTLGRTISVLVIFVRDGVVLIMEIGLSISSVILFKKYLKAKSIEFFSIISSMNNNNNCNSNNGQLNPQQIFDRVQNYNIRLTKMTIYLSIYSILIHVVVAFSYIQVSLDIRNPVLMRTVVLISYSLASIKFISNFFLFYYFNPHFRNFFRCKKIEIDFDVEDE